MKTKYILGMVFPLFLWTACVKDLGNYDYIAEKEILPVTISGFNDTTVVAGDVLNISPVLNDLDDESRYTHLWYVAFRITAGFAPQRDTLAQTRDLSALIKLEPDIYNLVYILQDPERDIYVKKSVVLTVAGIDIQNGLYVLKDLNDETDFDYIAIKDRKVLSNGVVVPDVLKTVSGEQQLKGKAVKMVYHPSRYCHEVTNPDGTVFLLQNQKALHILSTQDIKTFNANNLLLFKGYDEEFYEAPLECRPQNVNINGMNDVFLLNAGKAHGLYVMSSNVGKFGYECTLNEATCDLHDDMLTGIYGTLCFDKQSRSFLSFTSAGATMDQITSKPDAIPLQNMNVDLVSLIDRDESVLVSKDGYALMRSVEDQDQYYLASISSMGNTNYPFNSVDTIPKNKYKMPEANVFASKKGASCIYFSNNNILNVYIASGLEERETVLKEFPSDEKISYIRNVTESDNDLFFVVTNNSSGWKLYCFEAIGHTPDINPEPIAVYSGTGNARYLMLR